MTSQHLFQSEELTKLYLQVKEKSLLAGTVFCGPALGGQRRQANQCLDDRRMMIQRMPNRLTVSRQTVSYQKKETTFHS